MKVYLVLEKIDTYSTRGKIGISTAFLDEKKAEECLLSMEKSLFQSYPEIAGYKYTSDCYIHGHRRIEWNDGHGNSVNLQVIERDICE